MTEILIVLAWSSDMSDTLQPVLTSANKTWRHSLIKYRLDVHKNGATAVAYLKRNICVVATTAATIAAAIAATAAASATG